MREAVIVDAIRTPIGRGKMIKGDLSGLHAAHLLRRVQTVQVGVIELGVPTLVFAQKDERLGRDWALEPHAAGDPLREHSAARLVTKSVKRKALWITAVVQACKFYLRPGTLG